MLATCFFLVILVIYFTDTFYHEISAQLHGAQSIINHITHIALDICAKSTLKTQIISKMLGKLTQICANNNKQHELVCNTNRYTLKYTFIIFGSSNNGVNKTLHIIKSYTIFVIFLYIYRYLKCKFSRFLCFAVVLQSAQLMLD